MTQLDYNTQFKLYSLSINIYVSLQWIIKPFQKINLFSFIFIWKVKYLDNTKEHIEIFEPNVQLEQKSLWDEISFIWLWSKMVFFRDLILFLKNVNIGKQITI